MAHELTFEDGKPITPYDACSIAEGFCGGDQASPKDHVKAWSYIQGTGMTAALQGFYGRACRDMIDNGLFTVDGTVDWGLVEERLDSCGEEDDDDE